VPLRTEAVRKDAVATDTKGKFVKSPSDGCLREEESRKDWLIDELPMSRAIMAETGKWREVAATPIVLGNKKAESVLALRGSCERRYLITVRRRWSRLFFRVQPTAM